MRRPSKKLSRLLSALVKISVSAVVLVTFTTLVGEAAYATEAETPFLPGVTIAFPIGMLPPPGLYYSQTNSTFSFNVKNQSGINNGVRIQDTNIGNIFTYVPTMPKILGATYGVLVAQPVRVLNIGSSDGTNEAFGIVNTIITPVILSWDLGSGFFVSSDFTAYIPDSDYRVSDLVHTGRNYFTAEPGLGVSYLGDGWNISVHPVIDFNTTNPANGYKSGYVFAMDYTVLHHFGKFDLGLGGTFFKQFTNDAINGLALAALPGIRGFGNRAENFNIGPIVGYDFGAFSAKLYYNKSVYARNIAVGDEYWLRFDVPLTSKATAPGAK